MKKGFLSQHFEGVAYKRLSAVEVDPERSHQHEFNGVVALRDLLGPERREFKARFAYLSEDDENHVWDEGSVTWYDAREKNAVRSEYRLYFPENDVMREAREGDLLVVATGKDGKLLVTVAPTSSTMERQVMWLFGLPTPEERFLSFMIEDKSDKQVQITRGMVLATLGVQDNLGRDDHLQAMLKRFGGGFPKTAEFSSFAREIAEDVKPAEEPDTALITYMTEEEGLFRTLEENIVGARLREGFGGDKPDVGGFVRYSLSVHNRRKSRVGQALENHLEFILKSNDILHTRGAKTENKSKPDFLFPGITEYRDPTFDETRLTVLGAKTTCKDRWRQVLSEATRVNEKHLLTLEPGISEDQTTEMKSNMLQLVVPRELQDSYTKEQQDWLLSVGDFLSLVRKRQVRSTN